jgi:fermentation-respiration switch protein FrsA (DUF1100 family)
MTANKTAAPQRRSKRVLTPWQRRWRRIKWVIRGAIVLGFLGYVVFVGLDRHFFYYPNDKQYVTPAELDLRHEEVWFTTEDGVRLHGWFLPTSQHPKGVVVHFHGNAANISNHLPLAAWLPDAGYHVLMFDYRGYGKSEGSVTRAGTIRDGHAAIDYVQTRPDCQDLPLLVYGQSLGGAIAVVVTAEHPEVKAIVAETTFSSHRNIARLHAERMVGSRWLGHALATLLIPNGYDPLDVVADLPPRPLLVIAADNDNICFPELGRELYDAAAQPKEFWLARGEHLDILDSQLINRVSRFFDDAVADPSR